MTSRFQVSYEVELGHFDGPGYIQEIVNNYMGICIPAREKLKTPQFSTKKGLRMIRLASVALDDLGFTGGCSYPDACSRALQEGLKLCVPEVAPALRLCIKHKHPDRHKCFSIGMDTTPDGLFFRFTRGSDGQLFLDTQATTMTYLPDGDERLIFALDD